MDTQRLVERVSEYAKACSRLKEACEQPEDSFIRDSVIQRFEFCWELTWKMLRLKLQSLSIEAANPRDTFREALQAQLISDGNIWTEMQRMRNLTSHTYDEALAKKVYDFIKNSALAELLTLAKASKQWGVGGD